MHNNQNYRKTREKEKKKEEKPCNNAKSHKTVDDPLAPNYDYLH